MPTFSKKKNTLKTISRMERKQMLEKLEQMKKELSRKQKKLEKAKKAARAKAHVKQKLQELNLQASREKSSDTVSDISENVNTSASKFHAQAASFVDQQGRPDGLDQRRLPGKDASIVLAGSCQAPALNLQLSPVPDVWNFVSNQKLNVIQTPNISKTSAEISKKGTTVSNVSEVSNSQSHSREVFPLTNSDSVKKYMHHQRKPLDVIDTATNTNFNQCQTVFSSIEDSLAVTPTFRSSHCTDMCTDSNIETLHPILDSSEVVESCTATLTLNINSEENLCDGANGRLTGGNMNHVSEKWPTGMIPDAVTTQSADLEIVHMDFTRSCVCHSQKEYPAENTSLWPNMKYKGCSDAPEDNHKASVKKRTSNQDTQLRVATVSMSEEPLTSVNDTSNNITKEGMLQDRCANEKYETSLKGFHPSPFLEKTIQEDQFENDTELDVIPFSQFERTEDLLGKSSRLPEDHGQRKKGIASLFHRKSPRLSFGFGKFKNTDSETKNSPVYRPEHQLSSLFKLAKNQRKSKTALLVTSLFEYLIDDAKRDAQFVEFTLPNDVTNLVSCCSKDDIASHSSSQDVSSPGNTEQSAQNSLETYIILETEIDTDLMSQRIHDKDVRMDLEDNQLVNRQFKPECKVGDKNSDEEMSRMCLPKNDIPVLPSGTDYSVSASNPVTSDSPDSTDNARNFKQNISCKQSVMGRENTGQSSLQTAIAFVNSVTNEEPLGVETTQLNDTGTACDHMNASDSMKNVGTDGCKSMKPVSPETDFTNFPLNNASENYYLQVNKHSLCASDLTKTQHAAVVTGIEESSTFVSNVDKSEAALRLQDMCTTSSQGETASQDNAKPSSSVSRCDSPQQDTFLDYTELDVIPFSQFELTEDFLSCRPISQSQADSSQNRRKRKGLSTLIQRKSPRLSSFEFVNSGSSTSCEEQKYKHRAQQYRLFTMAKKQRKTQKALLLSSLFEYLIDEAKRDASFVEFSLPEDLKNSVIFHWKKREGEGHSACKETSTVPIGLFTGNALEVDLIPETEIDPDFLSQKVQDFDQDSQLADQQFQLENRECLDAEHRKERKFEQLDTVVMHETENEPFSESPLSVQEKMETNMSVSECVNLNQFRLTNEKRNDQTLINSTKHRDNSMTTSETLPPIPEQNICIPNLPANNFCPIKQSSCQAQATTKAHVAVKCVEQKADTTNQTGKLDADKTNQAKRGQTDFTTTKGDCGCDQMEPDANVHIKYASCAESGCMEPVVDTVVGTVSVDGEDIMFILSVQTSVLTLWTHDDQQEWSAEFHWYLPQGNEAQGVSRIYSAGSSLTVLIWGSDTASISPFITVFDYQWDTQHTQRFGLQLPFTTTRTKQSVFCHGLPLSHSSVLMFTSDKASTRGGRYKVDVSGLCLSTEVAMEAVNEWVIDLRMVDGLPDAAVGLTMDQTFLIWNHRTGGLILSLPLPRDTVHCSRMFTCYSLQGYLILHMMEDQGTKNLCLAAVNPSTSAVKVLRRFVRHTEEDLISTKAFVHQNFLLSLSTDGLVHLWDASTAKPVLSFQNKISKILTANMFSTKDSLVILTGQECGCMHLYSLCF